MAKTIGSSLKKYMRKDEPIYDYVIFGPSSLDDPLEIRVKICYGTKQREFAEQFIIGVSKCTIIKEF